VGASPVSGTLTEADFMAVENGPQTFAEALDAIRDGGTYVNVHTEMNQAGEIRGQLEAEDLPPTDATGGAAGNSLWIALLGLVAAAALVLGVRRFAFQR
ncbi:MAG: CHRD domain-containing protein, partial [Chloroflexi bacterium]|nr:CHRD domain-containing protein [Chloroflexota bacterium]